MPGGYPDGRRELPGATPATPATRPCSRRRPCHGAPLSSPSSPSRPRHSCGNRPSMTMTMMTVGPRQGARRVPAGSVEHLPCGSPTASSPGPPSRSRSRCGKAGWLLWEELLHRASHAEGLRAAPRRSPPTSPERRRLRGRGPSASERRLLSLVVLEECAGPTTRPTYRGRVATCRSGLLVPRSRD